MDSAQQPQDDTQRAFEREKWEAEQQRLDREFALRERELHAKEQETRRARLWNPLAIAILGATVAAIGNAYVSWQSARASAQLETFKAESARIFEMIKTGNPDVAAKNLNFLLSTGLIQSPETVATLKIYLTNRLEGEGISLPDLQLENKTLQRELADLQALVGALSDSVSDVMPKPLPKPPASVPSSKPHN